MDIESALTGGDPRSLGNTELVVLHVLDHPQQLDELFACLFQEDEVIRMRASDALEKICRVHPDWCEPLKKDLFTRVSKIKQPSVQWHFAQIMSQISLTSAEQKRAVTIMKDNLDSSDDWIVQNLTLESLAVFARKKVLDDQEYIDMLIRFKDSDHKSVAKRCEKLLKEFS